LIKIKVLFAFIFSGQNLVLNQILLKQHDYYTLNYFKDKKP